MKIEVTARKEYVCDYCGEVIAIGDKYIKEEQRVATFNDDEKQIGIEFFRFRFCADTDKCQRIFYKKEYPEYTDEEINNLIFYQDNLTGEPNE